MQLAPSPLMSLDPKRIAATSAAIVVHLAVLMMLMMPAQVTPSRPARDTPMMMVPIEPIVPPPPPQVETLAPPRTTTQAVLPRPTIKAPVENAEPRPSDIVVERPPTGEVQDTDFPESSVPDFAQIRADLAPAPPYPPQALKRRMTGLVMLRVLVDETGKPVDVTIETGSGQGLLDDAAAKFVLERWHFVPATQDGRAVRAYALVPISFELRR